MILKRQWGLSSDNFFIQKKKKVNSSSCGKINEKEETERSRVYPVAQETRCQQGIGESLFFRAPLQEAM